MAAHTSIDPTANKRKVYHGRDQLENHGLSSTLWQGLPENLIELILAKLPFSSLVHFCSVCKGWRDLILSSKLSPGCAPDHGVLFFSSFYDDKKVTLFNSGKGKWGIVPLQFLEEEFNLLEVVASAGGLLWFVTHKYGEFVLCNPLTKCYKRLQMPCKQELTISEEPCMPIPVERYIGKAGTESLKLLVGFILDPDTGHFQLIVAGVFPNSKQTTLLYDSYHNSWKKVGNVPPGVCMPFFKPISCDKNLFVFSCQNDCRESVLKYDSVQQAWSWIPIPEEVCLRHITMIEQSGKIVLMTAARENRGMVELSQLQDSEAPLWLPARPLHLSSTSFNLHLSDCLGGQGDVIYFLHVTGLVESHKMTFQLAFHNVATNLCVLSNWEKSGSEYAIEDYFGWQIFKPSLLPIK